MADSVQALQAFSPFQRGFAESRAGVGVRGELQLVGLAGVGALPPSSLTELHLEAVCLLRGLFCVL